MFEEEQKKLEKLWQEALSDEDENYKSDDEESLFGDVYLSDEYQCESSLDSQSSSDDILHKKTKKPVKKKIETRKTGAFRQNEPSTSTAVAMENAADIQYSSSSENDMPVNSEQSRKRLKKYPPKLDEKRSTKQLPLLEEANDASNNSTAAQHVTETIETVVASMTQDDLDSDENDLSQHIATQNANITWGPVTGNNLKQYAFSEASTSGFSPQFHEDFHGKRPCEFYNVFVNDDILNLIVVETNRYAAQCLAKNKLRHARIISWHDTTVPEIKKFLGIVLWMGLCNFSSVQAYWSKSPMYQSFISGIMSRKRFQLLLRTLHFSDNTEIVEDRLQKLTPLVKKLKEAFQRIIVPGEYVCIDETLVPFQGRLKFKQYIANKRHKFGIKLFKLCLEGGYTYDFKIYCGKEYTEEGSVPTKVVLTLMHNLLDKGRTLCTDNYYTLVTLAHELLRHKTHLIGTLRANRKFNPKNIITKKLKVGETIANESNSGIVIQKWKDKRDVLMLTTKHTDEMVPVPRRRGEINKPKCVIEYNRCKAYIDISDQKKSYNSSLRKSLKWYRKLAIELLTGTAFINAFVAYQDVANEPMSVTKFREEIITELLQVEKGDEMVATNRHMLVNLGRQIRRRCVICYSKNSQELGRKEALKKTPQTTLKCPACDKHYCLECFFENHEVNK